MYYDVDRGNISKANYYGNFDLPILESDKKVMNELSDNGLSSRELMSQIKSADNIFKEMQNNRNKGTFLTIPRLIDADQKLRERMGIIDKDYSAAINAGNQGIIELQRRAREYASSKQFSDIYKEQAYFNRFKNDIGKLKDANLKSIAMASAIALETGNNDPITGEAIKSAYDLNIGEYEPVDVDKRISDGLDRLVVQNVDVSDNGSFRQIDTKKSIDKKAASDFFDIMLNDKAMQRNIAARGYGKYTFAQDGNKYFALTPEGEQWMQGMLDAKTQVQDVRTSIQNKPISKSSSAIVKTGGMDVTNDIALKSFKEEDKAGSEGGKWIVRRNRKFNKDQFDNAISISINDPQRKAQLVSEGLITETGEKGSNYDKVVSFFENQNSSEIIKQANPARASGNRRGVENKAENLIRGTMATKGLIFKKVPDDLQLTSAGYEIRKSGDDWEIKAGNSEEHGIWRKLKRGVHYDTSTSSTNARIPYKNEQNYKVKEAYTPKHNNSQNPFLRK